MKSEMIFWLIVEYTRSIYYTRNKSVNEIIADYCPRNFDLGEVNCDLGCIKCWEEAYEKNIQKTT